MDNSRVKFDKNYPLYSKNSSYTLSQGGGLYIENLE